MKPKIIPFPLRDQQPSRFQQHIIEKNPFFTLIEHISTRGIGTSCHEFRQTKKQFKAWLSLITEDVKDDAEKRKLTSNLGRMVSYFKTPKGIAEYVHCLPYRISNPEIARSHEAQKELLSAYVKKWTPRVIEFKARDKNLEMKRITSPTQVNHKKGFLN